MKGSSESKTSECISYISDVHIIFFILSFLTQSEIRGYSYTSKSNNRTMVLNFRLIKYNLNLYASREYYKSGIGEVSELGEKIRCQIFSRGNDYFS